MSKFNRGDRVMLLDTPETREKFNDNFIGLKGFVTSFTITDFPIVDPEDPNYFPFVAKDEDLLQLEQDTLKVGDKVIITDTEDYRVKKLKIQYDYGRVAALANEYGEYLIEIKYTGYTIRIKLRRNQFENIEEID